MLRLRRELERLLPGRVDAGCRRGEVDMDRADQLALASRPEARCTVMRDALDSAQLLWSAQKRTRSALPGTALTSRSASWISTSCSAPMSRHKTRAESMTSGMTDSRIMAAMKSEASGSHPVQPVYLIRIVDKMTPTLPSVSCALVSISDKCRRT